MAEPETILVNPQLGQRWLAAQLPAILANRWPYAARSGKARVTAAVRLETPSRS